MSNDYSYYHEKQFELFDFKEKVESLNDYIRYMLDRTQRMFEYEGLPDTIPQRMLEFLLQVNGFACIAEHEGNLYAFRGGLGGKPDPYYRPTICVVANPALNLSKTYNIDEDCVIMKNDATLTGLIPMFRRYATALVENDLSFNKASINLRIMSVLSAPDDDTKKSAEKYLDDIVAGRDGVIASNEFLNGIKVQPMTSAYRTFTDLIEYHQYLTARWYNELGLNANYNMKREKLSTTESQMNSDALLPLADNMLVMRQEACEAINKMFGTNITVDFASSWKKMEEEVLSSDVGTEEGSEESESEMGSADEPDGSVRDSSDN